MSGIRKTIQSVFKNFGNGLSGDMVIGPSDLIRKDYDILIVDEAHRLCRRRNIVNMSGFDKTCESLGLDKESANQLDWIETGPTDIMIWFLYFLGLILIIINHNYIKLNKN